MASYPLLLLSIFSCLHHVLALNILAIVSLPLRSHYMAIHPLFRELAIKGHSVTVMNNYPDKDAPKNMQFVDLQQDSNDVGYITPMDFYETFDSNYLHLYNFFRHFQISPESTKKDCENFFTNENAKAHFDKGIKYDVIFVEMFMGECGLAYAGALYDAPIIGITSHVMLPSAYPRLGIPFNFDSDAFYFSNGGPNPSLYHKSEALILDFIYNMYIKWFMHGIIYEVFDQYLPINTLDMEKVTMKRLKMMFVYQHYSLTGARLLAPQVLEIGGVHIGKPKPVPENIKKFLADAEHGAIYVSFGSNLKANTMTPEKLQEFLKAFKKIPQKVIWKFENASLPEGYDDYIYTDTWMPQVDVLCNPKVIGFISHGGMLGLSEAAYCGKPAVVMPFFGDQFGNAASAQAVGLGHTVYFDRLNADTLADAIEEITSTKMQENAKRISKLWHDRPMSVMDSAIYWTEYVARHQSAPPSLPSKQSAWYERMLLDVALVILILLSPVVLIVAFIIKLLNLIISKIFKTLFGKRKSKKE